MRSRCPQVMLALTMAVTRQILKGDGIMRMSKEHYQEYSAMILEELKKIKAPIAELIEHYKSQGLSSMRLRWDIHWSMAARNREKYYELYDRMIKDNLLDTHIDTALKKITGITY